MANGDSQSLIAELRQLNGLVDEMSSSLKSQKEVLQRRGMNLPPMVMRTVSGIKEDLQRIETTTVSEQSELGQLRALAQMSAAINTSLELDQVLEDAMDVVITLTEAERGYIILKNTQTGELEFRISRDNELGKRQDIREGVQISMSIVHDVMDSGEAMLTDNAYKDERLQGNVSVANFSLRSVLCVPLTYKDDTIGVMYVDNRLRAGIFQEREKNLLMAFAHTAAVAIANARLYAEIQSLLAEITAAQQLMENVFGSIGSGVIASDHEDLVTTFNRAAEDILERKSEEAIGKDLKLVLPRLSADIDDYVSVVREKNESQLITGELDMPARGRIAVNMKLSPLKDSEKRIQGVAVVLDDVTEQNEREMELTVMRRLLPPQMVDQIHTISNLALGGERREVTCLYVDVRPISTLPEGTQPTEMMDMINVYLAVAANCIHAQGGIIDKYMGNEVMALFNTQLNPMDNHAERAIVSALCMRTQFLELYAELGLNPDPHFYRIGMHTGVATLGNVGSLNRREFTAIGDTINLSKRLQENAGRQQIIVSEVTRQHFMEKERDTGFEVEFHEREPIKVKGRQQSTRIYEVFKN